MISGIGRMCLCAGWQLGLSKTTIITIERMWRSGRDLTPDTFDSLDGSRPFSTSVPPARAKPNLGHGTVQIALFMNGNPIAPDIPATRATATQSLVPLVYVPCWAAAARHTTRRPSLKHGGIGHHGHARASLRRPPTSLVPANAMPPFGA